MTNTMKSYYRSGVLNIALEKSYLSHQLPQIIHKLTVNIISFLEVIRILHHTNVVKFKEHILYLSQITNFTL